MNLKTPPVTPETLATWLETPEWAFFQSVVLEKMREHELGLRNLDPNDAGKIGQCQGFVMCSEGIASAVFANLLQDELEKHTRLDGAQSLAFKLKLFHFNELNRA